MHQHPQLLVWLLFLDVKVFQIWLWPVSILLTVSTIVAAALQLLGGWQGGSWWALRAAAKQPPPPSSSSSSKCKQAWCISS